MMHRIQPVGMAFCDLARTMGVIKDTCLTFEEKKKEKERHARRLGRMKKKPRKTDGKEVWEQSTFILGDMEREREREEPREWMPRPTRMREMLLS